MSLLALVALGQSFDRELPTGLSGSTSCPAETISPLRHSNKACKSAVSRLASQASSPFFVLSILTLTRLARRACTEGLGVTAGFCHSEGRARGHPAEQDTARARSSSRRRRSGPRRLILSLVPYVLQPSAYRALRASAQARELVVSPFPSHQQISLRSPRVAQSDMNMHGPRHQPVLGHFN